MKAIFCSFALPLVAGLLCASASAADAPRDDQSALVPALNQGSRVLQFDWPTLEIGTGEYEDGPTGVTVIHFTKRVFGAVDVRGGGPGTVNTDYLRIGYDVPELDAVVFSGGSWYGLENTTAVATALKDDGSRDGIWTNLALSVGAIIYDFGDRRLNEIYPDKRLAQAAFRAARPGVFPLGAQGAGRLAKTGSLFGCNAFSGQGAAFRQIGELKIAAFVVVNALGAVTRRDGRVAACYPDTSWPKDIQTADLLAGYPASRKPNWAAAPLSEDKKRNTTISLIVTNQKLPRAQLERLATQVHSSMGRAIQPFATEFDGDVLYAVSTAELDRTVDESETPNIDLDVIASEVMWDAILSSVPEQPARPKAAKNVVVKPDVLKSHAGEYVFSRIVKVRVTADGATLSAQATGPRNAFAIGREKPVQLQALSPTQFTVPGRYPLVLDFASPDTLIMNPGHWQQTGKRQSP
ncbi:MAG: P1 family peptidase [Gammaproteobacteria bacterium]